MKKITGVTNSPYQKINIPVNNAAEVGVSLYYFPTARCWYADIEWGTFKVTGLRLVINPNLLRQWMHILPFGLGLCTTDGNDPSSIDAFSVGQAFFVLMTPADLVSLENTVYKHV